jgi:hypothetical protein
MNAGGKRRGLRVFGERRDKQCARVWVHAVPAEILGVGVYALPAAEARWKYIPISILHALVLEYTYSSTYSSIAV